MTEYPGHFRTIKKMPVLFLIFAGFHQPELQSFLVENKKHFVLVAGPITSECRFLTAANATQGGYLVATVVDCCADKPEAHRHTMERYPFIFVRTTAAQIYSNRENWTAELEQLAGA